MALAGMSRFSALALLGILALTSGRRVEHDEPDDLMLDIDPVPAAELVDASANNTSTDPSEHQCEDYTVSRRRRAGDMCSCRRRSHHSGLQPGWSCNASTNKITFVGLDDLGPNHDTVCCCKPGACSMEAVRRGGVVEHVDNNVTGGLKCCKTKERGLWGTVTDRCPARSSYSELVTDEACDVRQVVSSVEACTEKVAAWLRNPNWFKALINWEDFEPEYEAYLACGVTKEQHVNRVMIDKNWNGILGLAQPNPIRFSILNRGECDGLSDAEFEEVAEMSHSEVCSWYLPQEYYRPQLQPTSTCNFDDEERRIDLHPDRMCPEGHRCACPVYSSVNTALGSASFYSLPSAMVRYGIMAVTYTAVYGPIIGVTVVSSTMIASPLVSVASPIVGVVAFGAAYVYRTMHFSCSRQVGCFPMDCVHVSQGEHQGCRIRPAEHLEDQRNPFWFMPPPNYKCSFNYGSCTMRECSRTNKMQQSVGLINSTSRLGRMRWSAVGISTVHNCQPLLHSDMSSEQKSEFQTQTQDITAESREYMEERRVMAEQLERQCPWKKPMTSNYRLQCNDGTSCTAVLTEHCCDGHRGIAKCPRNRPYMCADDRCDSVDNACEGRGGLKPCEAERLCPWLVPLVEVEDQSQLVRCGDSNGLHCVEYEENMRIEMNGGPYDISTCHDECGWKDSANYTCSMYASSNRWCSKYGQAFESGGHTAGTACCACGNRSWIGTHSSEANHIRGYRREPGYFLIGYAESNRTERDLIDAIRECNAMGADCQGVTCTTSSHCTLRLQGDVHCALENRDTFSFVKENRRGGRCCLPERKMKRCPYHKPVMCSDQTCGGTHCCAASAEACDANFGGPRICDLSRFGDVSSGATGEEEEEFEWAVGNRVMDTTQTPGRCGTLSMAAVGTADPTPFRMEYDDGSESEKLSEDKLGRSESCAVEDDGTDEMDELVLVEEEEEEDEEPREAEFAVGSDGELEN